MTAPRARAPIGMLIRNTHRQPSMPRMLSAPAKTPPTSGPTTAATPKIARKKPWYLARSRGARMSPMIASGSDIRPPAPMPCTARNPASISMDVEKLDSTDPAMKIEMLRMMSGRRPNRSDSLPYSGVVTVEVIR
jgi:hypothetical protein